MRERDIDFDRRFKNLNKDRETGKKGIEAYLREEAKKLNWWAPKWVSPGNNGVPDRILFIPDRRITFIETKAPGKKPSPDQRAQHQRMEKLGWDVRVIDSKEKVDQLLQELIQK